MSGETRLDPISFRLPKGFSALQVEKKEFDSYIEEPNFSRVFPNRSRNYFQIPERRKKQGKNIRENYSKIFQLYFLIYDPKRRPVGWSYGESQDATTFYMRNTGILPKYRDRGLYSAFLSRLLPALKRMGYERVSSDHHPNNVRVLTVKLRAGFVVTGILLDERWGPLVRLTYFMHKDRKRAWERVFSLGRN